ncbi:hypothetical protein [Rhizobium oryzicola]|uniref:Uncharacterized protein n=1 Tax=Rhizobium oryzicola TaxID=1232668 RepID=A0ABT8T5A4_9HYPH|nr:hypothetical protein [Rhizobium oryzicola]MDO1585590.1 hypothetical protein [Rhizobium oryzicola]
MRNVKKVEPRAADWSQQEIADFYRAHRLLAENGAAIGIDRGLTDIGEPWMVFFDMSSQDVFLHVARIDNRCHLISEPLNLRLSAADITALITDFEEAVRSYLAIRVERSRNVVIHPAARIIMSISAIFLLFKLESGEAHAKGLSEKQALSPSEGGGLRLIDKASPSFLRAQSAFARAFESVDAPANAAMLAGMILASELVFSNNREFSVESDLGKLLSNTHHEEATIQPLTDIDEHKSTARTVVTEHAEKQKTETVTEIAQNRDQDTHKSSDTPLKPLPAKTTVEAVDMPAPIKVADVAPQQPQQPQQPVAKDSEKDSQATVETTSTASSTLTKVMQSAADSAPEKVVEKAAVTAPVVAAPAAPVIDAPKVITLDTLDTISAKAGLSLKTNYDIVKMFALLDHFREELGQVYDVRYGTSGKLIIEEKGIASHDYHDIGIWTNTLAEGGTFSVIAKVGLIDDALTFFS